MSVLIITEAGSPQQFERSSFHSPVEYTLYSLPAGKSIALDTTVMSVIADSTARVIALSSRIPGQMQLTGILDAAAGDVSRQPIWLPDQPGSLADFVVDQLGLSIACLWYPIWQAGTVILPRDLLISELASGSTILGRLLALDPPQSLRLRADQIDWSDHLLPVPPLVPRGGRASASQLELVGHADRWLPARYDRACPEFQAIQAGILLWLDELDRSHTYSQSIEGAGRRRLGDYWHAIMHRREPDPGNAKYWYRRVGSQVIFQELARCAEALAGEMDLSQAGCERFWHLDQWDPFGFIDWCEEARNGSNAELFARRLQAVEMILLMRETLADASTN